MFDNLALHSKATDQEMTAVEKFICFSQILKGRGHATPCRAIWGSTGQLGLRGNGGAPAWSGGRNEVPEV